MLLKLLKKSQIFLLICAGVFIGFQVFFEMRIPLYMAKMSALLGSEELTGPEKQQVINAMLPEVTVVLLLGLLSALCAVILTQLPINSFIALLRQKVFAKVQTLSMENIDRLSVPSLITRTTSDLTNLQMLYAVLLQSVFRVPLVSSWAIVKISQYGGSWVAVFFASCAFYLVLVVYVVKRIRPHMEPLKKLTDRLSRVTMQKLSGIDVIRAYNAQEETREKFDEANGKLTDTLRKSQLPQVLLQPGMVFAVNLMYPCIYFIGALALNQMDATQKNTYFSGMAAFTPYAVQLMMAVSSVVLILMLYPAAKVSSDRIQEILNFEPKICDGQGCSPDETGTIRFDDVSFAFPGSRECFLRNISFECRKGETVAIIGPTGCGKTTLLNLIMRFIDATRGSVYVDGKNVREYKLEALREKISLTQQRAVLFSGTIASNIVYGCEEKRSDLDYIRRAGVTSMSDEFVEKLPERYEAAVARGGSNFSGGQRQRLSIARTVAKPAEILIFDDSFTALDFKTDRALRDQLRERYSDVTKLIVAQRIGTIMDADRILVMENGAIVGSGTHRELLESCQTYREIAASQLLEEEALA